MPRVLLGGLLGGVAMWIIGFIFWGTPLAMLATSTAGDAANAALQATLNQYLGPMGSGAYPVPWPGTPMGTQAYGQGPVAMVFFNASGFAHPDANALISGLILSVICGLVFAIGLSRLTRGHSFGSRMASVVAFALAFCTYAQISQPLYHHAPWDYFIFMWLSQFAGWLAAGAVIAKLLPRPAIDVAAVDPVTPDPVGAQTYGAGTGDTGTVDPYARPDTNRF